jgi:hypothetical protein
VIHSPSLFVFAFRFTFFSLDYFVNTSYIHGMKDDGARRIGVFTGGWTLEWM